MFGFFKKKKLEAPQENEWTYAIAVDNVDGDSIAKLRKLNVEKNLGLNIPNISFGTLATGYVKDIVVPRIGEGICVEDDICKGIVYEGKVSRIFYNHPLKFISITFDCENVRMSI